MASSTIGDAAMSITLNDDGLEALERLAPGRVDDVIAKLAIDAATRAQQNIRDVNAIDTGYMVNTTAARRLGPLLWSVGTAAFYGVFIEYGTRYVAPRPWLTPAMAQARLTLAELLRASLRGFGRG